MHWNGRKVRKTFRYIPNINQNIDKVGQNFNEGLKVPEFRGGLLKDTSFTLILSLLTSLADHDKGRKNFIEFTAVLTSENHIAEWLAGSCHD